MPKYDKGLRDYILETVSIVDVVGEKVKLTRAGSSLKGLCPFHSEKTPSFVVSDNYMNYHCFGCGAHGNAIDFIMNTENVDFIEAMEILSDRYGVDISRFELNSSQSIFNQDDKKHFELNALAVEYFRKNLFNNESVLAYLKKRGLNDDTISEFRIGYSSDAWEDLSVYLLSKGFGEKDIVASGLASMGKHGRPVDRFRNRIMFPILDYRARTVGFGARALGDDMPKYLNSPENRLFKKSNILYGEGFEINKGKSGSVILVEGYMDAIKLCANGYTNVYASMGTALTENQAKMIMSKAKKIYFAYDMDDAGRNAILKSIPLLSGENVDVRIMNLKGAKDPDEFIEKFGKRAFNSKMEEASNVIRFRLNSLAKNVDLGDAKERFGFVERAIRMIAEEYSDIEAEIYLQELSQFARLTYDVVAAEYQIKRKAASTPIPSVSNIEKVETGDKESPINLLERQIISYSAVDKDYAALSFKNVSDFNLPEALDLLSSLMLYYTTEDAYDALKFSEDFGLEKSVELGKMLEDVDKPKDKDEALRKLAIWEQLITKKKIRDIDTELETLIYSQDEDADVKIRKLRQDRKKLLIKTYKNTNLGK